MITQDLISSGLHGVDGAHKVEAALTAVPGVEQVRVHYLKRQAHVTGMGFSLDQLMSAVRAAGYAAAAE